MVFIAGHVKRGSEVKGLVLVQPQTFGQPPLQTNRTSLFQHVNADICRTFARLFDIREIDYLDCLAQRLVPLFQKHTAEIQTTAGLPLLLLSRVSNTCFLYKMTVDGSTLLMT